MASVNPAHRPNPDSPHNPRPDIIYTGAGHADPGSKVLYRIPEAMHLLSLSRSVIYEQLRLGRLRSVKEGSTRLIPADAIADYVALLEAEAEADQ